MYRCPCTLLAVAAALGGCDLVRSDTLGDPDAASRPSPDAGPPVLPPVDADPSMGYPPPRTDATPAVGGPDTLDIATWNVRNLGTTALGQVPTDIAELADLIASLDLDVIAVEEVASIDAWNELAARLPEHEAVLSSHAYFDGSYQKIGILYRGATVQLGSVALLSASYPFPRPPLQARVAFDDGVHAAVALDIIAVHLKAGGAADDVEERRDAIPILESHIRSQVDGGGEDEVVLLGDFNQVLTGDGTTVLAPLLGAPDRYTFRTRGASDRREHTHASGRMLDHIVTTAGLAAELGAREATIVPLDETIDGYDIDISDHLPVVVSIPLAPR
jgi:endonuclease/exonuclease/phosphatase family metal-dependent hydrolase